MTTRLDVGDSSPARHAILAACRARLDGARAIAAGQADRRPMRPAAPPHRVSASDVDGFIRAVESVAGSCVRVPSVDGAARALRSVIDSRRAPRVAVSDATLAQTVARLAGIEPSAVTLDAPSLFVADVGLTTAQWGIVETGTLVLAAGVERHRLASLVPPVHVALLRVDDLRQTLTDVLADLDPAHGPALGHCVTFVTGPSRTSDIELTLAIGVHGPMALHVVVIDEAP